MKRWLNHRGGENGPNDSEDGQALIELALVVPLLFLLLAGAVEFARLTFAGIEVSNAAKAAVQYAAMNGGNTADVNGMTAAAQQDSLNLGGANAVTIVGTPTVTNACSDGVTTYSPTTFCGSAYVYTTVSVHTKMTFTPLISIPGFRSQFSLYGYAQELVLQ
ncbi:MAG: TadE/TadG family type IV pilus assembly protein [Terracidiphilus sp.]